MWMALLAACASGADLERLESGAQFLHKLPPGMHAGLLPAAVAETGVLDGECAEAFRLVPKLPAAERVTTLVTALPSCPGACGDIDLQPILAAPEDQRTALAVAACNAVRPDPVFTAEQARGMSWLHYLVSRTALEAVKDDLDAKGTPEAAAVWAMYEAVVPSLARRER